MCSTIAKIRNRLCRIENIYKILANNHSTTSSLQLAIQRPSIATKSSLGLSTHLAKEGRTSKWYALHLGVASCLTCHQAFLAAELEATIDWKNVALPPAGYIWVKGRGQMVYWKGCSVTVYETDAEGKVTETRLYGKPEGQGQLFEGTKLYCVQGKVVEA